MFKRCQFWFALAVVLFLVVLVGEGVRLLLRARGGPEYQFALPAPLGHLTETQALSFANEVIARDGLSTDDWRPRPDGRTTAPDGRRDEFMSRNSLNHNRGSFHFTGPDGHSRFVSVEQKDDRVVCRGSWGK